MGAKGALPTRTMRPAKSAGKQMRRTSGKRGSEPLRWTDRVVTVLPNVRLGARRLGPGGILIWRGGGWKIFHIDFGRDGISGGEFLQIVFQGAESIRLQRGLGEKIGGFLILQDDRFLFVVERRRIARGCDDQDDEQNDEWEKEGIRFGRTSRRGDLSRTRSFQCGIHKR
jgi:hypothetical protein